MSKIDTYQNSRCIRLKKFYYVDKMNFKELQNILDFFNLNNSK